MKLKRPQTKEWHRTWCKLGFFLILAAYASLIIWFLWSPLLIAFLSAVGVVSALIGPAILALYLYEKGWR